MEQKAITALLIDPEKQIIREVKIPSSENPKHLQAIYAELNCSLVDIVRLDTGNDGVFVDDEGLLKTDPGPFFSFRGFPNPIAGRGLVLGADEDGNSCAPTVTSQELEEQIVWLPTIAAAVWYAAKSQNS